MNERDNKRSNDMEEFVVPWFGSMQHLRRQLSGEAVHRHSTIMVSALNRRQVLGLRLARQHLALRLHQVRRREIHHHRPCRHRRLVSRLGQHPAARAAQT